MSWAQVYAAAANERDVLGPPRGEAGRGVDGLHDPIGARGDVDFEHDAGHEIPIFSCG
jgi:hypothetical protein